MNECLRKFISFSKNLCIEFYVEYHRVKKVTGFSFMCFLEKRISEQSIT